MNKSPYVVPENLRIEAHNYDVFEVWPEAVEGDQAVFYVGGHVKEHDARQAAEALALWCKVRVATEGLEEAVAAVGGNVLPKFVVRTRDSKAHTIHTRNPDQVDVRVVEKRENPYELAGKLMRFFEDTATIKNPLKEHPNANTPEAIAKREARAAKRAGYIR